MEACSYRLLLHLHRRSGLVQPRTVRVAERVPTDSAVLPGSNVALVMDRQPSAIRCRMILPTPNAPGVAPHVGHETTQHPEGRRYRPVYFMFMWLSYFSVATPDATIACGNECDFSFKLVHVFLFYCQSLSDCENDPAERAVLHQVTQSFSRFGQREALSRDR